MLVGLDVKLPNSAHTAHPWRIHELTRDLKLEDVWALPTPGGPDDFPRLVELLTSFDPAQSASTIVRMLFTIRFQLGKLLGWDGSEAGLDSRVGSVSDRMPEDLPAAPPGRRSALPFTPLFMLENEWAAETANRTVHGIIHLGWVPDGTGGYRGQLAILVKRNGLLGAAYMVGITPFRYLFVYPKLLHEIGRAWQERDLLRAG